MPELIKKVVEPTVEGYGCTAEFDYYFGPSPLINDNEELVKTARRAAAEEMGEEALHPVKEDDRGRGLQRLHGTCPGRVRLSRLQK